MIRLTHTQLHSLRAWFQPERPGPLIGMHILNSRFGSAYVDRWPHPRALLTETGGNYSLVGDPDAVSAGELRSLISGFMEAADPFIPLLRSIWPQLQVWPRVIYTLAQAPHATIASGSTLRALTSADAPALEQLDSSTDWIGVTWGGAQGLAKSGYAWGAFVERRLASVACSFFVGDCYEDVGIVTEPAYRRAGLAVAVVAALCTEIRSRGRTPTWATSLDNVGSQMVAEKVGFCRLREDRLFPIGLKWPG